MDSFTYRSGQLYVEEVPVADLVAKHGSPLYVYSKATFLDHYGKLARAFAEFAPLVCYSVKANGNLTILRTLREAGSGFDVVSGGELFRALRAGASPDRIVFAGVGKTDRELDEALSARIRLFTVESVPELEAISARAQALGATARVALRINPDVDAHTHHHITTGTAEVKFGMDPATVENEILAQPDRFSNVALDGLHLHIGSQITDVQPYADAVNRVLHLYEKYRSDDVPLGHIDIGGGFGINYEGSDAKQAEDFAAVLAEHVRSTEAQLILEPGRFIAGNAGILVSTVTYVKDTPAKRFVIVDGGMNDLIRPALYDATHAIWPVHAEGPPPARGGRENGELHTADVVGPICESADFLGKSVKLPDMKRGDLIAVFSAGAYSFSMSSNYNSRPRVAEVLVDGDTSKVIRERETYERLIRGEE
jgi:diaminopimelate decarboxylase